MFLSVVLFQTCRVEAKGIKKQLLIIGIVVILISVGLSGCDQSKNPQTNQNKFVGTWNATVQNNSVSIIFFSNDTMTGYCYGNFCFRNLRN